MTSKVWASCLCDSRELRKHLVWVTDNDFQATHITQYHPRKLIICRVWSPEGRGERLRSLILEYRVFSSNNIC